MKTMDRDRLASSWPLTLSSSRNSFSRFLICCAPSLRLALIPKLFAFSQSQLDFYPTILEVHSRRNKGQTLLLCLPHQLPNLFPMHQELPSSQRGMIEDVSMVISSNMGMEQPKLPIFDKSIRILEVSLTVSHGLDLSAS